MPMPTGLSLCLLLCVGPCGVAPVAAQNYQVELVIFERLEPEPDGELLEHLAVFPVPPAEAVFPWVVAGPADTLPVEEPATLVEQPTTPVAVLPDAAALPAEYRSLLNSAGYRPLLQLAWVQPAWRRSPPLWLPEMFCPAVLPGGQQRRALVGVVRIEDTGRLHLDLDLAVRGCLPADAPILRFTTRMRILLKRVYHLDHPRLGGLLRVRRHSPATDNE